MQYGIDTRNAKEKHARDADDAGNAGDAVNVRDAGTGCDAFFPGKCR